MDSVLKQAYGKILRLLHHILALRGIRNSLSSVSRLPPEVLLRVFHSCTPRHVEKENNRDGLAFSQVCASWRRLALADPSLWAHIDLRRPSIVELMVKRSQSMPVSLFNMDCSNTSLSLIPGLDRICSIQLTHNAGDENRLDNFIYQSYPLLHTLCLTTTPAYCVCTCDVTMLDAPRLQRLSLHNWTLRGGGIPVMANLSSLALEYDQYGPYRPETRAPVYSLSSILQILGTCRRLISLKLHGLINPHLWRPEDDRYTRAISENLQEVELPHLKQLDLREDVITLSNLLPYLHLPIGENITVQCDLRSSCTKECLEGFPIVLRDLIHKAHWSTLRAAKLELSDEIGFALEHWPAAAWAQTDRRDLHVRLLSRLELAPETIFLKAVARTLLCNLATLEVSIDDCIHVHLSAGRKTALLQFWASISTLPVLQRFKLHGNCSILFSGLLLALVPSLATGQADDEAARTGKPLPAIRTLTLSGLQMTEMVQGKSVLTHLAALLDRRKQQGRSFDVVLDDCSIADADADLLNRDDIRVL